MINNYVFSVTIVSRKNSENNHITSTQNKKLSRLPDFRSLIPQPPLLLGCLYIK